MIRLFKPRLFKACDGSTAVEFAIILPIFFALVFTSIEFTRFYWVRSTVQFAVEEAARYAMVTGGDDEAITERARERASTLDQKSLTVTVEREVSGSVAYIAVEARYDWPSSAFNGYFPEELRYATGRARVPQVN